MVIKLMWTNHFSPIIHQVALSTIDTVLQRHKNSTINMTHICFAVLFLLVVNCTCETQDCTRWYHRYRSDEVWDVMCGIHESTHCLYWMQLYNSWNILIIKCTVFGEAVAFVIDSVVITVICQDTMQHSIYRT